MILCKYNSSLANKFQIFTYCFKKNFGEFKNNVINF